MTPGAAPATRQAALDFTTNREVRLHDEPHRHWWGKFKSPLRHQKLPDESMRPDPQYAIRGMSSSQVRSETTSVPS